MNNKTLMWVVVIILIVIGAVWYFNSQAPAPETTPLTEQPNETATTTLPEASSTPAVSTTTTQDLSTSTAKVLTVTGSNFAFSPSTLTVKKGDKVMINFVNSGGLHDWKIDEFSAATKRINGGETDSVTFVADKAGSFEYYCSVGTHRQMGMRGTLVVTP